LPARRALFHRRYNRCSRRMQLRLFVDVLFVMVMVMLTEMGMTARLDTTDWRERHPQARHRQLNAWRMSCFSCMSSYLDDHYQHIAHLYRRPAVFSDACDHDRFDSLRIGQRNCSGMCITLRMNDRVGGRRRFGYLRGCMGDVLNYNESAVRGLSSHAVCRHVRLRDLFLSHERYSFEASDHVQLCSCHHGQCNSSATATISGRRKLTLFLLLLMVIIMTQFSFPS